MQIKRATVVSAVAVLLTMPMVASAQFEGIKGLAQGVLDIVNLLIPVAFSLILLFFFWGLAKYVLQASDEQARETGKNIMIGGVIALFVASSIWGIVAFIRSELGIQNIQQVSAPQAPNGNSNSGGIGSGNESDSWGWTDFNPLDF